MRGHARWVVVNAAKSWVVVSACDFVTLERPRASPLRLSTRLPRLIR